MAGARWSYGEEIEWREIWRGRVLGTMPAFVVEDRDDLLALYLAEGAPFGFPEPWPWAAEHPWQRRRRWEGHGALILHRPGDPYTVWAFWQGRDRAFAGWYVNLQRPLRRVAGAVETFDHELDIWVEPDGTWQYKDEDHLEGSIVSGRITRDEAEAIRETGRAIGAALDRGERWWSQEWAAWAPDPAWRQ